MPLELPHVEVERNKQGFYAKVGKKYLGKRLKTRGEAQVLADEYVIAYRESLKPKPKKKLLKSKTKKTQPKTGSKKLSSAKVVSKKPAKTIHKKKKVKINDQRKTRKRKK